MKKLLRIFTITAITIFIHSGLNAQACLLNSTGSVSESNCNASYTLCDYTVEICADVPASPAPKRITFTLNYDSNNDGTTDTQISYTYDPPGSGTIPAGTFCLSDVSEQFVITVAPNSTIDVNVTAFTGAGSGSDCVTFTASTIAKDNVVISDLPVELDEFVGIMNSKDVLLKWTTLSEVNSSHFEVEKMTNVTGRFVPIGKVESNHESVIERNYHFIDEKPEYMNYYRLRMVDYDGSFEYSKVVKVMNENVSEFQMNVFPNPAKTKSKIMVNAPGNNQDLLYTVYSKNGKKIQERVIPVEKGNNIIDLDMESWPDGQYILNIILGDHVQSEMIMKMNFN